ncbi:MAG: NAD-dependent epimerase/dehydratase family protein [Planctomycetes bacterium]|nr:NAD-dependent epimerase/dehydratase family protein [Planctomycetota bacterium]
MPTTYLITGGAGNLACRLTHALAGRSARIVLFDAAERPVAPVAAGCEFLRGDLRQPDEVQRLFRQLDCDREGAAGDLVLVHMASLLSGSSELNRTVAWRINTDATFDLLEASLRYGVRQFFFPSSVAAFGGRLPSLIGDDQPQWPTSLYGVCKATVERLGVYFHERHGLDFRCLRLPVVVSPYAPAGAASAYASRAFIEAVTKGRFVFRVAPETQPSLIYLPDVVQAILSLLDAPADRLSRRVYNIQALSPTARELAAAIVHRLPRAELRFDPDLDTTRLISSWPIAFDDSAARTDWGWRPHFDLESMADDLVRKIQANESIC